MGEKEQVETNFILIPFSLRGIIKKAADDNRSGQTAPTDFFDKGGRFKNNEGEQRMDFLSRILKGLVVGVANIIPGVSGGTMAVVIGIYDKLIAAVSNLKKEFKRSFFYLLPIGIGAVLGILLFSRLIEFLLRDFTMPTNIFFLGLILGSIPMIYHRAVREKMKKSSILPFVACFAVMILMTFLQNVSDEGSALITTLTVGTAVRLFLSAALAAACMIMPGISGSMVMVLLGVYTSVLTAISSLNIPILIPVAFGVLVGLFAGAKGIDYCLKRYEQQTYFAILGLIAGSVLPILLSAGYTPGLQTVLSVFSLIAGILIAFFMGKTEKSQG